MQIRLNRPAFAKMALKDLKPGVMVVDDLTHQPIQAKTLLNTTMVLQVMVSLFPSGLLAGSLLPGRTRLLPGEPPVVQIHFEDNNGKQLSYPLSKSPEQQELERRSGKKDFLGAYDTVEGLSLQA